MLTVQQIKLIDQWESTYLIQRLKNLEHSNHIFINSDRIILPYQPPENYEHLSYKTVKSFLNQHNYEIDNYVRGIAVELNSYGRQVRIGKVLREKQASKDLIKLFENDSFRNNKNIEQYKLIISRAARDVASCSTGRNWNSCLNLNYVIRRTQKYTDGERGGGPQSKQLQFDIAYASMIAYLVKHDDLDIKQPIARVAIKPYQYRSLTPIFRPDVKIYGNAPDPDYFWQQVNQWCITNFEATANTIYRINKHVYSDNPSCCTFDPNKFEVSKLTDFLARHENESSAFVTVDTQQAIITLFDRGLEQHRRVIIERALERLSMYEFLFQHISNLNDIELHQLILNNMLAKSVHNTTILSAMIANSCINSLFHKHFVNHPSDIIRSKIARYSNELSILSKLSQDACVNVRTSLISNRSKEAQYLHKKLMKDPTNYKALAGFSPFRDILEHVCADASDINISEHARKRLTNQIQSTLYPVFD